MLKVKKKVKKLIIFNLTSLILNALNFNSTKLFLNVNFLTFFF